MVATFILPLQSHINTPFKRQTPYGGNRVLQRMSNLLQDPRYQNLRMKRDQLNAELKLLLDEWCWITTVLNPALRRQYDHLFGALEHQLQHYTLRYLRLQRFAELLQHHLERRTSITISLLQTLQRFVLQCYPDPQPSTTGEPPPSEGSSAEHHRQLYLELVKRLHPDRTGVESAAYRKYWNTVQSAYRDGNTALLRTILQLVETPSPADTTLSLEELQTEIATLECRIAYQRKKVEQLKSDVPYRWKDCINDPEWQREHRIALKEEIAEVKRRIARLQQQLEQWFGDPVRAFLQSEDAENQEAASIQSQFVATTYFQHR